MRRITGLRCDSATYATIASVMKVSYPKVEMDYYQLLDYDITVYLDDSHLTKNSWPENQYILCPMFSDEEIFARDGQSLLDYLVKPVFILPIDPLARWTSEKIEGPFLQLLNQLVSMFLVRPIRPSVKNVNEEVWDDYDCDGRPND